MRRLGMTQAEAARHAAEGDVVGALVEHIQDGVAHGGGSAADLTNHIADSTPHPAYDDITDLKVLLENGLI